MQNYTEENMNLSDFKTSMDNIFEISKFIYNAPKGFRMDRELMDMIAESLDYIKSFYCYTLYTGSQILENLKSIASEPKTAKNSNAALIQELNIELDKVKNVYDLITED